MEQYKELDREREEYDRLLEEQRESHAHLLRCTQALDKLKKQREDSQRERESLGNPAAEKNALLRLKANRGNGLPSCAHWTKRGRRSFNCVHHWNRRRRHIEAPQPVPRRAAGNIPV